MRLRLAGIGCNRPPQLGVSGNYSKVHGGVDRIGLLVWIAWLHFPVRPLPMNAGA
jgi:hypothetical protein